MNTILDREAWNRCANWRTQWHALSKMGYPLDSLLQSVLAELQLPGTGTGTHAQFAALDAYLEAFKVRPKNWLAQVTRCLIEVPPEGFRLIGYKL